MWRAEQECRGYNTGYLKKDSVEDMTVGSVVNPLTHLVDTKLSIISNKDARSTAIAIKSNDIG